MKILAFAALAALAFTSAATAQPRAARGDANADGRLSQAEFQALQSQRMMRLAADGDGKISLAEWSADRRGPKTARDPAKGFAALDANRDGGIDAAEVQTVIGRRFARLDADRDGQLSTTERRANMRTQRAPRAAATP